MKKIISVLVLSGSVSVIGATHYVDLNNPSPTAPYTNWMTAATSIQAAVNASENGDTVLVTNGHYVLNSEILVEKAISIESVNGPEETIIDAGGRCRIFHLLTSSTVSGFKLLNGYAQNSYGGAIYSKYQTTATNCIVSDCASDLSGGGFMYVDAVSCTFKANVATAGGGGMSYGSAINCIFISNIASIGGGIGGGEATSCLFISNSAKGSSGGGGGTYNSIVRNCTLVDNQNFGVVGGSCYNSIVYYNHGPLASDANFYNITSIACCCFPEATDGDRGNISSPPLFIDNENSDYRLTESSPCIGAGKNTYAFNPYDLDRNPRIVNATVDIGAYEFQTEQSRINLPMRVIVEQSYDLQTWTNTADVVEWLIPVSESNSFFRARLELD